MITRLRAAYNAIDRFFDFRAIAQEVHSTQIAGDDKQPKTAGQTLQVILPFVKQFGGGTLLKMIVSQPGLDSQGASPHWEFFFDLVSRKAKLVCEWQLTWNNRMDAYNLPSINIAVHPFPPPNSMIRKMVRDGQLLYRQQVGLWRQETRREPDLPLRFRGTDAVVADLIKGGLDITATEFSLSAGQSPAGRLVWLAQAHRKTYYADFC